MWSVRTHVFICFTVSQLVLSCCSEGWRKGKNSCYFISTEAKSWAEASNVCQSFHSELVSIDDAEENILLRKIVANIKGALTGQLWADGTDQVLEGQWVWASKMEKVRYTHWAINEPNNRNDTEEEDCMELYTADLTWNDARCIKTSNFICEKEIQAQEGLLVGK